jgi:hypothetical protein
VIRSSVLFTATAMALLVAGVAASSLALIYVSIAVSVLAAVTLAAGALLRRQEIFGAAGGTSEAPAHDTAEAAADGGAEGGEGAGAASLLDQQVSVVPGVARYHRQGCILIRFLGDADLDTMTRQQALAAGSVPCKACRPDEAAAAD